MSNVSDLNNSLERIVGPSHVLSDPEECTRYGMDWTQTPGRALIVVLPKTTDEVSKILKLCLDANVAVIASGGRTGLAGGVTATDRQVALSLQRMDGMGEVDIAGRTLRVQAGVVTQKVHETCEAHDLTWPIDLAAKGSSTIGGNLSTNAGGVRVVRYGMARKWVMALQAVLIDGTVLELNHGLEKNNTGYDLMQLLLGSEGTLAVITEATLKLTPVVPQVSVCMLAVRDVLALSELFIEVRKASFDVMACEFFSRNCQMAVEKQLKRKMPLQVPSPFYLLLEIARSAGEGSRSALEDWLAIALEKGLVLDGTIAESSQESRSLWTLREGITESIARTGPVRKYDVAVPVAQTSRFLSDAQTLFDGMKLPIDLYLFGHLGDGSPHLNLVKQESASVESFIQGFERFEKALYPLVKSYQGSVSAEHGVGLLKKSWLLYSRTPAELEIFRQIKRAFDPKNLLNPGKVIDL